MMKNRAGVMPLVLAMVAGGTVAMGQVAPETVNPAAGDAVRGVDRFFRDGFPFYDARLVTETGLPTRASLAAAGDWMKSVSGAKQMAAFEALRARVSTVAMDRHTIFGTPDYVRSTVEFLTDRAVGQDAKVVVADFVRVNADLFAISTDELNDAAVSRDYRDDHNGVRHLSWQQRIGGVDIMGAQLHANVMPDGRLINIGGTMLTRPDGDFKVVAAKLTAQEAIARAAANVALRLKGDAITLGAPVGADERTEWSVPGARANEAVVTRKVYFPMSRGEIRTAWLVFLPTPAGPGHTYDIVVDAVDGTVLYRENHLKFAVTQPVTFRVYTSDSPQPGSPGTATPTGFQFPTVARSLVTVTPEQQALFSPNGWINDGGTETLGNNCDAHTDLNADNIADLPRPNGGAGRVFDFAQDLALAPSAYTSATTSHLFYLCNTYHDRMYALGFTEAAGNFQTLNFSGFGVGNDPVLADAQDGSGTNNANWQSTGTDGSSGRTQMYVFTGPTPDRDGSLDSDIVFHEFSHGLSIRLHQGRLNAANQEGGMGEGWSDFFALCLNSQSGDDFNGVYAACAYATLNLGGTFANNYYFGIRRFPYSTDMTKNPLTYADLDPAQNAYPPGVPQSPVIGNTANEVHNVGELWCMTLLECRANMSVAHGFAANDMIMRLAVDGMKLDTASDVNFLNERDGILQSDLVNNGGANQAAIWQAFAKRGQGASATSPATATSGIVEAYDLPFRVDFTYPGGTPSQLLPGVATGFDVNLSPLLLTLVPNSGLLHYSVNGGAYQTRPMTAVDADTYHAEIPGLSCFDRVNYYVSVDTSNGRRTHPANAPISARFASVFESVAVAASDNFETATAWTVGPNTATTGLWVRGNPVGTTAQPEDDVTAGAGVNCWVTGLGVVGGAVGDADVDGGNTLLTSPTFDLSAQADATISYYRWFDNSRGGAPGADVFTVQVSTNNGASWTNAEVVGPSGAGTTGGWIRSEWSLSSLGLTPTAQVRVRFIADDAGTGSIVEAAVDEFAISNSLCTNPPPACPADWNADGAVDGDDVIAFFGGWDTGNGDFNGDGGTDGDDVIEFFAHWDSNC